jgi:IS5 family transposase
MQFDRLPRGFEDGVMDLFLRKATERLGSDDVSARSDALMKWPLFLPILKDGLAQSGIGPQGYVRNQHP